MKYWIIFSFVFISLSCSGNKADIERVLTADGVTEIKLTGYDMFCCSESDSFSMGFTGIKNGKQVSGCVCSGLLKGATIRYK